MAAAGVGLSRNARIAVASSLTAIAVLAVLGYTGFRKRVVRVRAANAKFDVIKLHDAAKRYVENRPIGEVRGFPKSTGPLPRRLCANGEEAGGLPGTAWQHPTWRALGFAPGKRVWYRYSFISGGSGPGAWFTARAEGDLDCDGVLSTFEMAGRLDAQGRFESLKHVFTLRENE